MGYGGSKEEAAQVTKTSGDEGMDRVINENRLGFDVSYLQAKRWRHPVAERKSGASSAMSLTNRISADFSAWSLLSIRIVQLWPITTVWGLIGIGCAVTPPKPAAWYMAVSSLSV